MRIAIVTDAWYPQVNGVVRTLDTLRAGLEKRGHAVGLITPAAFRTLPCLSYPEIRLALAGPSAVGRRLAAFGPGAIHIATEGPLGIAARCACLKRGWPFTTAFHTRFPEYIHARWRVPLDWSYRALRRFHAPAAAIMVATATIEAALRARGFANIRRWGRGVDTELFRPREKGYLAGPRPIALYVGRVAIEKNIEAFLALDLPGAKVVVGDGPALPMLRRKYPAVRFVGTKTGDDLARHYAAADVFVFPSRTDTFGLVLLEALASGVPVAAFPVPGPLDVIGASGPGALDADLGRAARRALQVRPEACRAHALGFSWDASVEQFLGNLKVFA